MLILVQIDLSHADIPPFDAYEAQVLRLLVRHGARLEEQLRSVDGLSETHLLHFSDKRAFKAFRADPARAALQDNWQRCGAQSNVTEVLRLRPERMSANAQSRTSTFDHRDAASF